MVRVDIYGHTAIELQRESFILYIAGEKQVEYGYENAAQFAAALDRVLRSDEFRNWLSRRLGKLGPHPGDKPDRK